GRRQCVRRDLYEGTAPGRTGGFHRRACERRRPRRESTHVHLLQRTAVLGQPSRLKIAAFLAEWRGGMPATPRAHGEIAMTTKNSSHKSIPDKNDAIGLLKADHRHVEEAFEQFKKARSDERRQELAT